MNVRALCTCAHACLPWCFVRACSPAQLHLTVPIPAGLSIDLARLFPSGGLKPRLPAGVTPKLLQREVVKDEPVCMDPSQDLENDFFETREVSRIA